MSSKARKNEPYLYRDPFVSLFPIQALAVGLPAINMFVVNFIIGKYVGAEGLAAMGFVTPLNSITAAFTAMLSTGMQILCGRYLGKGDTEGIKKTFSTCAFTGAVIGLLLGIIVLVFASPIAVLLGARGELQGIVVDYLRGYIPSFFLLVAGAGFLLCLQMDNAKKLSVAAIVVQLIASVTLSYVFVHVMDMGMFGAGLALTVGNLLLTLVCCLHFTKSKVFRWSMRSISAASLKEIFTLGANAGINNVWNFLRTTVANNVVFALGGTLAMSAMTVALNVTNAVAATFEGGMVGACNIISSVLVGKREVPALRRLHKTAAAFTLPIDYIGYFLIFVFAKPIALLFGAEAESIALYVKVIRVFNLWMLTSCFKAPPTAIYNALGRVKLMSVFNFLSMLVYTVAIIEAGNLLGSLTLTLLFPALSEVMLYLTYVGYYVGKTHRLPEGVFDVCYIPRTISVPKADTFTFTVKTNADAAKGSVLLTDFCTAHGMDEKLSRHCGLCLEEVSVEDISRFPAKNREKYLIEVRGFFEDGHLSLMFYDNLPEFDVEGALKLYQSDKPDEGLGIKIVSSLADEMEYSFALGMNSLTIKL